MGSALRRSHHAWLLKIVFVLAACFAAGLVTAGVVSGAGLSGFSSDTDTGTTTTEATETTDTTATETEPTETEPTESTPTETEPEDPAPTPNPPCIATGDEALATDKAGYLPGAFVAIVGTGFGASCDAQLRITLPDETTSTETVSTDADGAFGSSYTLPAPAIAGDYLVEARGVFDAVLASTSFEGLEPVPGAPFIWTDRDDYKPGEIFVLRGSGWLPGEAIQVVVDDDDGDTWLHTAQVVAGADGTFTNQFQLPDWFVAVYTVTATGGLSGVATTTFTDAVAFGGCGPYSGSPPHTITVNTTTDEWNDPTAGSTTCSLREAVRAANLDPGADTIVLPAGTYQLTRAGSGEDVTVTGDLDVLRPVTISGGGARTTVVQAGTTTLNGIDRVFHITSAGSLTMSQLTVQFGRINDDGGGIRLSSSSGTQLSLTDVTVRSNSTTPGSGKDGGGISAAANLVLNRVTISGNSADQHGGGLHLGGTSSTLTNVTVTSNTAVQQGGGIRTNSGTTTLTNVTVSHNAAPTGGGIRRDSGDAFNLRNTIVSNNTPANCSGSIGNTNNNLDSAATCAFGTANGSQSNANPNLGALANNGGPTDTRALVSPSAAIDKGTATSAPNHDQRSVARPLDGDGLGGAQHDVGAYEAAAVVVVNQAPVVDLNGAGAGSDTTASFTEGQASPTTLAPATTVTDADDTNLESATITLTNRPDGASESLAVSGCAGSISVTAYNSGTGVLALSGTSSVANYQACLRLVTYNNTSQSPNTANRSVTFVVYDGTDPSVARTATVTVNAVDDDPTAVDDADTVAEDSGASAVNVLANDTDPDAGPMSIQSVTQPANGTVVVTGGGSGLTYEPDANYCNGGTPTDDFTYTLNGGSTATVRMTVTCVDDDPTAVDDADTVAEDSGASAVNVLANDTDPDAGPMSIQSVTQPANGTVVVTGGGSGLTYEPDANYCNGGTPTDDFTYTLNGGSTATVRMTVTCVDDDPTAVDDADTVAEDSGASAVNVLANDTDPDAGPMSIQSVTQPANGTVVVTGGGSGLTYEPDANYCNGGTPTDDFTYTLNGGSTATVRMTVTCVDDDPTAVDDADTVAEDSGASAVNVLANDTDPDAGPMSIQSVTQPANGTVVVTGGGSGLTYEPDANYCNGGTPTDDFTYTLNGGSTATVRMTVTCVDDDPTAVDDADTVAEDSGASAVNVLANDTDPDAGPMSIQSVTQPANGTVVVTGGGSGLTYEPDANYCNGGTPTDDFTYTLNGGSTATVRMTVTCVDDDPTAVDDADTVAEDSGASAVNVLANDTDPDAGPMSIQSVTQPANGTVVVTGGGSGLTYEPDANYCNGGTPTDDFTYTLNGGSTATVRMTVTCVNDPPTVNAGGDVSGAEGSPISLNGTVSDVENDDFTVAWTWAPVSGVDPGAMCSFADPNAVDTTITCTDDGTYSATLTATDEHGDSSSDSTTVTVSNANPVVTVTAPDENTAPVSVGTVVNVQASFTDAGVNDTHTAPAGGSCQIDWGDGTTTTGVVTETPQSGSGSCTGSHAYASLGVYTITVTVTDDDGGSGSQTAQIVVFDPNAGFVTGGGWIMVQPGSYTVNPAATGKGNFGFVSKYKPGASTPSGETEFNFNTAGFRFHSDTYKVLLVAGFKAQYTGTGSVNGESGYDFRLTAYDGQVNGGGGVDKFRIKIRKNGVTIFDNRVAIASDDMETADPQAIGGGSIVIHKAK